MEVANFFPKNVHLCLGVNLRLSQEYIQNEEEVVCRTTGIGTVPCENDLISSAPFNYMILLKNAQRRLKPVFLRLTSVEHVDKLVSKTDSRINS